MGLRAIAAGALLLSAAASGEAAAAAVIGAQPGSEGRRLGAPTLTAAQIVEKNVAARGGLEAWRKIEAMTWAGRVEGGSPIPMPFFVQLKRPNLTHFEITAIDRRFVRIFDGTRGWRVRPGAGGAPEATAFSSEEAAFSRDEFVIDGPLVDHEAKGVKVVVAGLDEVDGRKAHLLDVTLPSGASRRIWIDAETFLEIRSDRPSTSPLVHGAPVSVYYRDFRSVEGLVIPFAIESQPEVGGGGSHKLVIEKVALNPETPERAFSKPTAPASRRKATVRITGDASSMPAAPARPGP
jgi:hypothetical protein